MTEEEWEKKTSDGLLEYIKKNSYEEYFEKLAKLARNSPPTIFKRIKKEIHQAETDFIFKTSKQSKG